MVKSFLVTLLAFSLAGSTLFEATAAPRRPYSKQMRELFASAKKALEREKYKEAATQAWRFMRVRKPIDEDYENAEFILAHSLNQLKFRYPATEYYIQVVEHGAGRELIGESLASVIEIIRKHPHDQYQLEVEMIAGSEFEFLAEKLIDSVRLIKGKIDFQRGDEDWAKALFSQIDPESIPGYEVRYALGVEELKEGRPDQAVLVFEEIAEKAPKKTEIRNRALQGLARMRYEEKKYEEALTSYDGIDSSVLLWDEIFLEKAWNTYHLEMYERALGHLHALHAPIFKKAFQPERYLLLGMILRRLCRFQEVRDTIGAFRQKYGSAVEHLQNGRVPEKHRTIAKAAETKHVLKAQADFLETLQSEQKRIQKRAPKDWKKLGLRGRLLNLYAMKMRQVRAELKDKREEAIKEVAEELLYYNEQMNLLEYEIRMDEFRRSRFSEAKPPEDRKKPKMLVSKVIHWPYTKEFWIDELNHFTVKVDSLCEE